MEMSMKTYAWNPPWPGSWYDADPVRLKAELEGICARPREPIRSFRRGRAACGLCLFGPCAAAGMKALAARPDLRRVVVLGFSHRVHLPNRQRARARDPYRSPLGETPLDTAAIAHVDGESAVCRCARDAPRRKQRGDAASAAAGGAGRARLELVPVTLGQLDDESRDGVAAALAPLMDETTALVVSSDFTHYGPNFGYVPFRTNVEANLRALDGGAIAKILAGDAAGFAAYCENRRDHLRAGFHRRAAAHAAGEFTARELAYDTSGRSTGDFENSVSYAAWRFTGRAAMKNEPVSNFPPPTKRRCWRWRANHRPGPERESPLARRAGRGAHAGHEPNHGRIRHADDRRRSARVHRRDLPAPSAGARSCSITRSTPRSTIRAFRR
jgi:MEMO1 family protein